MIINLLGLHECLMKGEDLKESEIGVENYVSEIIHHLTNDSADQIDDIINSINDEKLDLIRNTFGLFAENGYFDIQEEIHQSVVVAKPFLVREEYFI